MLIRWSLAFFLLFAGVFFAFWWSGSAIRFGASRVADTSQPTYQVSGVVRDSRTGQPIPWAAVEDDPGGQPPFFRADADQHGAFSLLTLAEPHRLRVSAFGYKPLSRQIGRHWFVWMPQGEERLDLQLTPE